MSLFSKLFGGGKPAPEVEPETYNGYRIYAAPESGQGGFRIGARIEKDFGDETKTHHMIRADRCQSSEEAERISLLKAKLLIDQQGDDIFG